MFERFREALPRGTRLRIVSYPDRSAWTLDDYVEHVERSLPPGERPLIVAESFSGPIALRLLCRRADLAGLVLVASFDGCPNPLLAVANAIPAAVVKAIATSPHLLRFFCLGHDVPPEGLWPCVTASAGCRRRACVAGSVCCGLSSRLVTGCR
ncbi:alpha/beta fold hydrolase [Dokdonella koreensis]|uniref:alpha/beta fold hydrolase n=1 Tax=Dokdonella koreensis TaxID=323415 RepID=UPI0012370FDF|nr:hypothetical protein [Dokdonella koreensis]